MVTQMRVPTAAGSLTIGTPETFLRTRLAPAFAAIRATPPDADVYCWMGFSDAVQDSSPVIDAQLGGALSEPLPHRTSKSYIAGRTVSSWYCPPPTPRGFTKRDLSALRPLHLGEACFFGRSLMSFLDARGIATSLRDRVNSLKTIAMLIDVGLGFSVLPQSFVHQHPYLDRLAIHPLRRRRDLSYFLVAKGKPSCHP